jgi:heterodisulfide reductase subunit C
MVIDGHGTTDFLQQVIAATPGGERITNCLQCGTCGGSCPNGAEMQYTPRAIIHLIQAGFRDEVLKANTMWQCVSCYLCTQRCPQQIPITDLMYTLKQMSHQAGLVQDTSAPALATTFTGLIRKYGRSFELGLATRYYLRNKPASLMRMGPLGLSMLRHGRLGMVPDRIHNLSQLTAIIERAAAGGES